MRYKTLVRTPLGEFATVVQAAAAHHCDRHTIMSRCRSQPEQYQVQKTQIPGKVAAERTVKGTRWPISWRQYGMQTTEVKEEIYRVWCKTLKLDPDTEATAEQFFDEMDQYTGEPETDAEDTEHDAEN